MAVAKQVGGGVKNQHCRQRWIACVALSLANKKNKEWTEEEVRYF